MTFNEYCATRRLSWEHLLDVVRHAKALAPELYAFQQVAAEEEASGRLLELLDGLIATERG